MAVDVVTFGCRLNTAESEVMTGLAASAGLTDATVFNTCAVTGEAMRQARQAIRRAARDRPGRSIVVTGCGAQTDPDGFAAMPETALVLGNDEKMKLAGWSAARAALAAPRGDGAAPRIVADIMAATEQPLAPIDRLTGRTRAFVQVQNGCNHRCTFCIIPFGRGNSRSVAPADAVRQVRRLVDNGYREVVLTGVDITSYGDGRDGAPRLGALVRAILAAVPDLDRLRVSSIDSVEADADLLHAVANEARFMPHLHLSLQAGDDMILKRMKRRHLRDDAIRFCADMRRLRPDMAFSADMIAGFPTETDAMFNNSLDLVDACGLTQLHVFPFSPRPGTPAARMPPVPGPVVKERARRLREKGEAAFRAHLDAMVGRRCAVLAETEAMGRTECFTPVGLSGAIAPGAIAEVSIAGHDGRRAFAA